MVLILHRVSHILRLWPLQVLPVFKDKRLEDATEKWKKKFF